MRTLPGALNRCRESTSHQLVTFPSGPLRFNPSLANRSCRCAAQANVMKQIRMLRKDDGLVNKHGDRRPCPKEYKGLYMSDTNQGREDPSYLHTAAQSIYNPIEPRATTRKGHLSFVGGIVAQPTYDVPLTTWFLDTVLRKDRHRCHCITRGSDVQEIQKGPVRMRLLTLTSGPQRDNDGFWQ
jgi:hypothetical protein